MSTVPSLLLTSLDEPILEAALDYGAHGLAVHPCDPITKKPLTPHGFKDATHDPVVIRYWWQVKFPGALIGAPTGPANGFWGIDLDPRDEFNGFTNFAELCVTHRILLPPTRSVRTPSGGQHRHFLWDPAHPVGNSASKLAQGVDTRGDGGYLILPPSIMTDGTFYEWENDGPIAACPPRLLALMPLTGVERKARRVAQMAQKPRPERRQRGIGHEGIRVAGQASPFVAEELARLRRRYGEAALTDICSELANTPEGARNSSLFKAACAVKRLLNGDCIDLDTAVQALVVAAYHTGLDANEVEHSIDSGFHAAGDECAGPPDADPGLAAARAVVAARRRAWFEQHRRGRQ